MTSYVRKRALLACDFCRHRKRRCDGGRPCTTCIDAQAECTYPELATERVDAPISHAVTERLTNVESLLEEHSKLLHDLRSKLDQSTTASSIRELMAANSPGSTLSYPVDGSSLTSTNETAFPMEQIHFLIPQQHRTSTNWLLSLPKIRDLLGNYPNDFFHEVEVKNPLPTELSYSNRTFASVFNLQAHEAEPLIEQYFSVANCYYPVLSHEELVQYHSMGAATPDGDPIASALGLLVCALGALSYPDNPQMMMQESNALQYFASAMQIINDHIAWSFTSSVKLAQALVLAASFLAHMGRPLHSWRCIQAAFSALQQTIPKQPGIRYPPPSGSVGTPTPAQRQALGVMDESQRRVFWACFLIECDRVAELELARSGVETWVDDVLLPRHLHEADVETLGFVAETSVRRLLNRIHNSLYSASNEALNTTAPTDRANIKLEALHSVASELMRQLDAWWASLPTVVKPPLGVSQVESNRAKVLRIRYYAAMHIIHRPFILYVAEHQNRDFSNTPGVLLMCEACVNACRVYLMNSTEMQRKRSPYLWTFTISSLGALLVLSIANAAPQLRHLVADLPDLQQLVIDRASKWATKGSSFEAAILIIETIQSKEKFGFTKT